MNKRHIFLSAPMGSGKDFAADYMAQRWGIASLALADFIREYITQNKPDYKPKSSRALEIEVGEMHRKWFGSDFWCRRADIRAATWPYRDTGVLIRDGRFSPEYDYFVTQRGYAPVKILAADGVRIERLRQRDGAAFNFNLFNSPADCEIINRPGYVLRNDGTPGELYAQIDEMMARLERGDALN